MKKGKEINFSPTVTIFIVIVLTTLFSFWFMSPATGQEGKASKDVQTVPAPSQKAVKIEPPVPATNPVQLNNLLTAAQVNPTARVVSLATEKGPAKFHKFNAPTDGNGKYMVYEGSEGAVNAIVENGKVVGSESVGLGIEDLGQVQTGNISSPDCWHCYTLDGQNHCLYEKCATKSSQPKPNNTIPNIQ